MGGYSINDEETFDSAPEAIMAFWRKVAAEPDRLHVLRRRREIILRSDRKEEMC